MLNTYKFKFKYANGGIKSSGSGEVKAEDTHEAIDIAQSGVANDMNGSVMNVSIVSIRKVNAKKKRHANHN